MVWLEFLNRSIKRDVRIVGRMKLLVYARRKPRSHLLIDRP